MRIDSGMDGGEPLVGRAELSVDVKAVRAAVLPGVASVAAAASAVAHLSRFRAALVVDRAAIPPTARQPVKPPERLGSARVAATRDPQGALSPSDTRSRTRPIASFRGARLRPSLAAAAVALGAPSGGRAGTPRGRGGTLAYPRPSASCRLGLLEPIACGLRRKPGPCLCRTHRIAPRTFDHGWQVDPGLAEAFRRGGRSGPPRQRGVRGRGGRPGLMRARACGRA